MAKHGQFFPDNPANLAELVDSLARRSAAAERLMNSLTEQQRNELGALMEQAMNQAGLAEQMARLQRSLRAARPDLQWGGSERMNGERAWDMPTAPRRWPSWPIWTSWPSCPCRTIPAPAWPTSTRNWSSERSASRRCRICSSCARSSVSCNGRVTWNRAAAAWS